VIGPLCYIGGKRRVARQLVALLPPHTTYIEPFAGGAQVLFHKPESRVEVLNDVDGDIVNFFRVCQLHADELIRWMTYTIASRQLHRWYADQEPTLLTDIQRAARFLYLQKNSFGGLVRKRAYHYAVTKRSNFDPRRVASMLQATADRLARVQIEALPYQEVLTKYDRPTTLFYLDPPYIGRRLYRFNLAEEDFADLATRLSSLRGHFLLSINDCPLSRTLFGAFNCRPLSVTYTASRRVPIVQELLFSNYDWPMVLENGDSGPDDLSANHH
jgi:DNA adenine methylase